MLEYSKKLLKQMKIDDPHPLMSIRDLNRFILPEKFARFQKEVEPNAQDRSKGAVSKRFLNHFLKPPALTVESLDLGPRAIEIHNGKTLISKITLQGSNLNSSMAPEDKKIDRWTRAEYLRTPMHFLIQVPGASKIIQQALERGGRLDIHDSTQRVIKHPGFEEERFDTRVLRTAKEYLLNAIERAQAAESSEEEGSQERRLRKLELNSLLETRKVITRFELAAESNPQKFRNQNIKRNQERNQQLKKAVDLISSLWPREVKRRKNEQRNLLVEKRKEANHEMLSKFSDSTFREQSRKALIVRKLSENRIKRAANLIGEVWKSPRVRENVIAANLKKKDEIWEAERKKHKAAELRAAAEAAKALELDFTSEDERYDAEFLEDLRMRIANGTVVVPKGYNP